MRKTIIVSQDKRAPNDMIGKNYTIMSRDEFIDLGNSEEGIDVEEKIYFNIDSLNQFLYEAIKESPIYDLAIFYKFSDQDVAPDFEITEGIRVYEVVPKEDKTNKQETVEEKQTKPEVDNTEVEKQKNIETAKPAGIEPPATPENLTDNVDIVGNVEQDAKNPVLDKENLLSLLGSKYEFRDQERKKEPAKVIVFGSSKGGTGKSTTCLICARRYAKTHPEEKVALADFDIIDGQIGISILKVSPTLRDFYRQYSFGNKSFEYLSNVSVKSEHFSPNLDFYLAPPIDIPEVTNNEAFWTSVFELLITNYDVVFFDTGIDYLGISPISRLYTIATKIILTCSTSINAVNSVSKQIQNLKGKNNNVFKMEDRITDRVNVVLTRVDPKSSINDLVVKAIRDNGVPIIAAFSNLDDMIAKSQWRQQWEVWDIDPNICKYLDNINQV